MQLANINRNSLTGKVALSNDQMMKIAPSIFAEQAHESRSSRYAYIPTAQVLAELSKEGFHPFAVSQSFARTDDKKNFTKHMVRLRHASQEVRNANEIHEVVIVNSHDGTSSYRVMSGVYRLVCCNGLMVGSIVEEHRIPHTGKVSDQVIDASFEVLGQGKKIMGSIDEMKALQLTDGEQTAFAEAALTIRYDDPTKPAPITARQLLTAHRSADEGRDMFRVLNRVQENVIRGGLRIAATGVNARRNRTRAVKGIEQSNSLNQALWTLAEKMKELKGVA